MKQNMGTVDRLIRVTVGVVIGVLYFTGRISGTMALVLGVIAVAFILTSLVAWCPGYSPFGFSTRNRTDGSSDG